MKKFTAALAALAAAVSLIAAPAASAEVIGLANPNRYDVSIEEMMQVTGIELRAPQDAENAVCNIIGAETEHPMPEMTFTLNGRDYRYRAQPTSLLSLYAQPSMEASMDEVPGVLSEEALEAANISGIYTEWTAVGTTCVNYCDAIMMLDGKTALIAWLDVVPGILYNLSVEADLASAEEEIAFAALAEELFVPLQGDADAQLPLSFEHEDSSFVRLDETGAANVSIFRLTQMDGTWAYEEDTIVMTVTDPCGAQMRLSMLPEEDGSFTLAVLSSTWSLLAEGETLPGFIPAE